MNPRDIPLVTVHDFTKFAIPTPSDLLFELKTVS